MVIYWWGFSAAGGTWSAWENGDAAGGEWRLNGAGGRVAGFDGVAACWYG